MFKRYYDDGIDDIEDEYDRLEESVSTLKLVIRDMKLFDKKDILASALEELVHGAEERLDELGKIIDKYNDRVALENEIDFRRSVL